MSRKAAFNVIFVAAAATLGVYLSRGPWMAYKEQRTKTDLATKEMNKAETAKNELRRKIAEAESPMGQEAAARRANYLKKGEELLPPLDGGSSQPD